MASIVLLAASATSEWVVETQEIPAGDWVYRDVPLHQQPARISASYEVLEGSTKVRAALMLREDLERLDDDLTGSIAVTQEGRSGYLGDRIRRRGDYAVVLDNRDGKKAATVRLRIWLDTHGPEVGSLTRQRQLIVLALSCVAFLGIVGFSAQRLLKAMRS